MRELIDSFPRQVAVPWRMFCSDESTFYKTLNRFNGIKPKIYFSVFRCNNDGSFQNVPIRLLPFDLDNNDVAGNAWKLHQYCMRKNFRHCIIFSTGGFWVYIRTKNYENLKNPKVAIKNAQTSICDELGLTYGPDKIHDVDSHIFGDIARVGRMPGSFDTRRKLFCVSVTREELGNGKGELGKKQHCNIYWYGSDCFDLSGFDREEYVEYPEIPDCVVEREVDDEYLKKFPPCIQDILMDNKGRGNYKGRWWFTIFMKEMCLPRSLTDELAKKYFSRVINQGSLGGQGTNYDHYCKVKVIDLAYRAKDQLFPSCEKMYADGFCDGKCEWYGRIYK